MTQESPLFNPKKPLGAVAFLTVSFLYATIVWVFYATFLLIFLLSSATPIRIRRYIQQTVHEFVEMFQLLEISCLEILSGVHFLEYGDISTINRSENAIIIANHPTIVDWMIMWGFLSKYTHLKRFRVLLRADLQHIPFIGYCIQIACMLFLVRDWIRDESTMTSLVEYYRNYSQYYTLLIFPEGTNISTSTIARADEFCTKQNMKLLNQLLPPRVTGFNHILFQASGLNHFFDELESLPTTEEKDAMMTIDNMKKFIDLYSSFDAIYDLSIAYTPTRRSKEVHVMFGRVPVTVHTHLNRIEVLDLIEQIFTISFENDPLLYYTSPELNPFHSTNPNSQEKLNNMTHRQLFQEKVGIWLMKRWYNKDVKLTSFYDQVLQLAQAQQTHPTTTTTSTTSTESSDNTKNNEQTSSSSSPTSTTNPTPIIDSKPILSRAAMFDPLKPHNTVLYDKDTFIHNSKPTWYLSIPQLITAIILMSSCLFFSYQLRIYRWYFFINCVVSIIILTVLKKSFFLQIVIQSKKYEENILSQRKKSDDMTISNSETDLVTLFNTKPSLSSALLLLQQQQLAQQADDKNGIVSASHRINDDDQTQLYQLLTPRQLRIKNGFQQQYQCDQKILQFQQLHGTDSNTEESKHNHKYNAAIYTKDTVFFSSATILVIIHVVICSIWVYINNSIGNDVNVN